MKNTYVKVALYIVPAVLVGLGSFMYSQAADNVIKVCVQRDGNMKMVGVGFSKEECTKKESTITWNSIGQKGEKGDTGLQGIQGPKGDKGAIGDQGPIGLTGVQGIQGEKGETGRDGLSLAESTLFMDTNIWKGTNLFTNPTSDFAGTWQSYSPSNFQPALNYIPLSSETLFTSTNIFNRISLWLSDPTNGVQKTFTGEVHTNKLCIEDTCITKEQLQQMLNSPCELPQTMKTVPCDT